MVFEKITRTYLFQIALIISSVLVRDIHLIVHLIPSKFTFCTQFQLSANFMVLIV